MQRPLEAWPPEAVRRPPTLKEAKNRPLKAYMVSDQVKRRPLTQKREL